MQTEKEKTMEKCGTRRGHGPFETCERCMLPDGHVQPHRFPSDGPTTLELRKEFDEKLEALERRLRSPWA